MNYPMDVHKKMRVDTAVAESRAPERRMDVRSVTGFCKECGLEMEKRPTPHDAMADVEKQIVEVQTCWQYVKVERAI